MSDRREAGVKNRMMAYIAAGAVHLLLIGALLFNYVSDDPAELVESFAADKIDTVKASVIDESQIKDQQEKLKQAELERERKKREEKQRELDELNKIKQQADEEKKRVEDLKVQQELEKQIATELEKERIAIALKKEQEEKRRQEEKRKRDREQRIAREKAAAEKKRIADLQKQLEEEDANLRERQRLNKLLAEEEAEKQRIANERALRQQQEAERRAKERTATLVSTFFEGIGRKIEQKRTVDPSFETWRKSVVDITLSPSGEVRSVRTIKSSGLAQYDQSVESAIFAASPFDMPDRNQYPDAVNRLLNFEFEVLHPRARR